MPLPLLLIFGAAAVIGTAIVIALLCWKQIVGWFQNRHALVEKDKDNIAVMIKEKMSNGHVKEIHGIFNKASETVIDGEQYEAETLDNELSNVFGDEDMVVLT